jgi:hypothetical protein
MLSQHSKLPWLLGFRLSPNFQVTYQHHHTQKKKNKKRNEKEEVSEATTSMAGFYATS